MTTHPHTLDLPLATEHDRRQALKATREEAAGCRRCPLWEIGTQTVFGDGPATAKLMIIGEAPGYHEDKEGRPFVGPAGKLFGQALEQAGLDRDQIYVTNTVKHRPWVENGRMGKNRAPRQSEINACRVWLEQEFAAIQPLVVGCLGALAAKWVLGKDFKLTQQRGAWQKSTWAPHVLATIHPAYVLIQPADSFDRWRDTFFLDFRTLAAKLKEVEQG